MSTLFVAARPMSATRVLRRLAIVVSAWVVGFAPAPDARADIYTWTDASGRVNISNLTPPDGVTVARVYREDPAAAARVEAAREKARDSELRALAARVQQLEREVELSAQRVSMPPVYAAPSMPAPIAYPFAGPAPAPSYAAPAPAPYGCDVTLFDCTTWWNAYPSAVFVPVQPYARHGGFYRHRFTPHPSHPLAAGRALQPGRPGYGSHPMMPGVFAGRRG